MVFIFKKRHLLILLMMFFYFISFFTGINATEFMAVNEVKKGMKGYAKTVVEGSKIETFDVEILGILEKKGPSGDLILARYSGELIDKYGGIAQGMSGSPVYIDGKLIGAIAYGWGFADHKIGMITPIEDMLKLWTYPAKNEIKENSFADKKLIPISTPLMAIGFDQKSLSWFEKKLPEYAFKTVDSVATGNSNNEQAFEEGSSIAAALVGGDLKLGAIGTVTYVDDDKILAFGHPFLKRGNLDYFMYNSEVFTVISSINNSFKLGSIDNEVGKITQDRGAGIAGSVGIKSAGIPLQISVKDLDTNMNITANLKIIDDEVLSPVLTSTSVYNYINKVLDRDSGGTSIVSYHLKSLNNKENDLIRKNMFYSANSINEESIEELYNVLRILAKNEFIKYDLMSVKVAVEVTEEKKIARFVEASASPAIVSAGETITFKVTLKPNRGENIIKEVNLKIPEDVRPGVYTAEIRGGGVTPLPYLIEKQKYNLTDEILNRLRVYKNFKELHKAIKNEDLNNELVVEFLEDNVSRVEDKEENEAVEKIMDKEIKPTPVKLLDLENDESKLEKEENKIKSKIELPFIIIGDGQLEIEVVYANKKEKKIEEFKNKQKAKS